MSLVVALEGRDSIVMASDSLAVSQSFGGPVRHNVRKVFGIGEHVLCGATGTISLIQKSMNVIGQYKDKFDSGIEGDLVSEVAGRITPIARGAVEDFRRYNNTVDGAPSLDVILAGLDSHGNPTLWHIGKEGNDENYDEIGYICSGGADSFGYALAKTRYSRGLDAGKLAAVAYRAIDEAIGVNAYGLGYPIDIWILKKGRGAKRLTEAEMNSIREACRTWRLKEDKLLSEVKVEV